MLSHRGRRSFARTGSLSGFAALAGIFSACAVYTPSAADSTAGSVNGGGGGGTDSSAGMSGIAPNTMAGASGAGASAAGASAGGTSGMGAGGASAGNAGSGVAMAGSSGTSGGGTGGGGVGGVGGGGTSGSGTAGGGKGGTGGAGAGGAAAGAPAGGGGSGGAVSTVNPCLRANWTATASAFSDSTTNTGLHNPPAFGIDGDQNTRWSLGAFQVGGEWYKVDLGARATHLTQVVLDTTKDPGDVPAAYKLELSDDGAAWTVAGTGAGATVTTINFTDHGARYIRVTQTGTNSTAWWTIHELTITCTP